MLVSFDHIKSKYYNKIKSILSKLKKLNNMSFIAPCRPKPGPYVRVVLGPDRLKFEARLRAVLA
jgi:hypothetical protein